MQLPTELKESLSGPDFAVVSTWWNSLMPEQQQDLISTDVAVEEFMSLPNLDEVDPEDELFPFYEYLTNHELRIVNFVADEQSNSAHRIVSSYIASLGSDYRHGDSGTVR